MAQGPIRSHVVRVCGVAPNPQLSKDTLPSDHLPADKGKDQPSLWVRLILSHILWGRTLPGDWVSDLFISPHSWVRRGVGPDHLRGVAKDVFYYLLLNSCHGLVLTSSVLSVGGGWRKYATAWKLFSTDCKVNGLVLMQELEAQHSH